MTPPRKITQKDVAQAAGVSQALVSLVLGSDSSVDVSPDSRERVLEAVKNLGYRRKRKPSQAVPQRNCLAYLHLSVDRIGHQEEWIFKSYDDFYDRLRLNLEVAARERGFTLISRPAGERQELAAWLSEWNVRGVFWQSIDGSLGRWIERQHPVVQVIHRMFETSDAVAPNQVEMVTKAMSYLMGKGHSRIGYIPTRPVDSFPAQERLRGYYDFVEANGLDLYDYSAVWDGELGQSLDRLMDVLRRPVEERATALIMPDHHALRLQKKMLQEGYSLPQDYSIVGIDNISACDFVHPGLTSIDGEFAEVCRNAVDLMIARLENPDRPCRKIEVSPRLVERESVATLAPAKLVHA